MEGAGTDPVAQGRQAVLTELGSGSPSSSPKTHVSPYSTVLERARSVEHADGGAFSKAVIHACWFGRVDVIFDKPSHVLEVVYRDRHARKSVKHERVNSADGNERRIQRTGVQGFAILKSSDVCTAK